MVLLTPRALWILAAGAILLGLALFSPAFNLAFALYVGGVVAAIGVDAFRTRQLCNALSIDRRHAAKFGQFEANALAYTWQSHATLPINIELKESGTAPAIPIAPWPLVLACAPGGGGTVEAHCTPTHRGNLEFPELRLRARSPWGLVMLQRRIPQHSRCEVVPSLGVIREFDRWARREEIPQRLMLEQGTAFKELRPYVDGDEIRRVDWKATARRGQVVVRELETERAQPLVLLIDCGRAMRTQIAGASRLDRALHAAL
ncbi:MAG: DUF58 domain-containing protein, partial [bacterium]